MIASSQMSPEIAWDISGFSPDSTKSLNKSASNNNVIQQQHQHKTNLTQHQHNNNNSLTMDY